MNCKKSLIALFLLVLMTVILPTAAFAATEADAANETAQEQTAPDGGTVANKPIGSGLAIGIAAAAGAIGMGMVVGKAAEGISRQPEASGEIRSAMMLGLVFIETAIIYALLAVILIIFVL